jgi:hypothetical protein
LSRACLGKIFVFIDKRPFVLTALEALAARIRTADVARHEVRNVRAVAVVELYPCAAPLDAHLPREIHMLESDGWFRSNRAVSTLNGEHSEWGDHPV